MDQTSPPVPLPLEPGMAGPKPRQGCLKWGLVGCGVLSALLIVGLVLVGLKARSMMGWALAKMEEQTLSACTPEVTPAQREEFHKAFALFVERAQQGKVPVERMSAFRTKLMGAIGDGKVTPDELQSLTVSVGESAPPK